MTARSPARPIKQPRFSNKISSKQSRADLADNIQTALRVVKKIGSFEPQSYYDEGEDVGEESDASHSSEVPPASGELTRSDSTTSSVGSTSAAQNDSEYADTEGDSRPRMDSNTNALDSAPPHVFFTRDAWDEDPAPSTNNKKQ